MNNRAEFEAWTINEVGDFDEFGRDECGNYINETVDLEFYTWQAAWRAARAQVLDEVLEEWNKPYILTNGSSFINRIRALKDNV